MGAHVAKDYTLTITFDKDATSDILADMLDHRGYVVFPSWWCEDSLRQITDAFMNSPKWSLRSPGLRWCVNAEVNYDTNPIWARLHYGLPGATLVSLSRRSGKALCVGIAGGDYADVNSNAQSLHTDYMGYDLRSMQYGYVLAVSIAVAPIGKEDAPIRIVPWSDKRGLEYPDFPQEDPEMAEMVTMQKGDILIRDVRCPHGGCVNTSSNPRLLPSLQVFSHQCCRRCHRHAIL